MSALAECTMTLTRESFGPSNRPLYVREIRAAHVLHCICVYEYNEDPSYTTSVPASLLLGIEATVALVPCIVLHIYK